MGRPERHIDPEAGPVQAFAAELRALREEAGRPKYAVLARRTGKSQTALAEAAGGRRLPTWETVAAYVAGCQGDVEHWRRRWQEVSELINPGQLDTDEFDEGRGTDPGEPIHPNDHGGPDGQSDPNSQDDPNDQSDPNNQNDPDNQNDPNDRGGRDGRGLHDSRDDRDRRDDADGPDGRGRDVGPRRGRRPAPRGRWRHLRWAVSAGAAGLVVLVTLVVTLLLVPSMTGRDANPGAAPRGTADAATEYALPLADGGAGLEVADEADPKDSGCAADPDVLSLDNVELALDRRPVGLLELRYSPRCGVAWPRFLPLGDGPPGAETTTVHVDVVRPADNRRAAFAMPYAGTSVFGNVLRSTRHCVIAEARLVLVPEAGAAPSARTACYRGRVREADVTP